MRISSLALDDFHRSPVAIQRVAKTLSFGEQEYEGEKYRGVGLGYNVEGMDTLLCALINANSVKIDMEYFRLGLEAGDLTDYIHADSGISPWAAVWYLSDAPKGVQAGTAFWRHKETGLTEVPTVEYVAEKFPSVDYFNQMMRDHANDESKWEMTGLIGQKFNRIVIYPTKCFHSRFPQKAWGKDVNDGRLIWTGFFSTT